LRNKVNTVACFLVENRPLAADHALVALGRIGVNPDQVIGEAVTILDKTDDENLWGGAIGALHALGEKAKPAVPSLVKSFAVREAKVGKQTGDFFLNEILVTIESIEPENPHFLRLLERILKDREYEGLYRIRAVCCLKNLGNRAQPYLPTLAEALRDDGNASLYSIIVKTMYPFKEDAVDALRRAMLTSKGRDCVRCIRAIGDMGKCATSSICYLEVELKDPDPKVRAAAKEAIRRIEMGKE
jgi:hypothetical protein